MNSDGAGDDSVAGKAKTEPKTANVVRRMLGRMVWGMSSGGAGVKREGN